jgi:hypothetical protein
MLRNKALSIQALKVLQLLWQYCICTPVRCCPFLKKTSITQWLSTRHTKVVDLAPCKVHDLIPKSTSSAPSHKHKHKHKHKHSIIHYSILVFRHSNPPNPRARRPEPWDVAPVAPVLRDTVDLVILDLDQVYRLPTLTASDRQFCIPPNTNLNEKSKFSCPELWFSAFMIGETCQT